MNRLEEDDLARLAGALLGVAIGSCLALALACAIFPPAESTVDPSQIGALEWVKSWARQEQREKAFYFLTLAIGSLCGGAGAALHLGGRRITLFSVLLLGSIVPIAPLFIGAAMGSQRIAGTVYAAFALFLIATIGIVMRWLADAAPPFGPKVHSRLSVYQATRPPAASWWLSAVACTAIISIFVIPLGTQHIASQIGFDMHMASFIIGPATYSFGPNLVPGIDYFTQYSVGTPWLFSFFLADTADATLHNAVRFVIAAILVFQVSLLFFLRWFLGSWVWAVTISLACLMLQFTTSSPLYAPSSTAARYPLLIICLGLFANWIKHNLSWTTTVLLAAALSASIFLNTETGLYTCIAVALAALITARRPLISAIKVAALGVMTMAFFMGLSFIAFGAGVFDLRYPWLLAEPLMLYSNGLGAWPIEWSFGYHWFYNIISPGLALASVGWVAVTARQSTLPYPRPHLAALAMISLVGLFFTAKFINMSIVALWQVNAIGLVIVLAWWVRAMLTFLPDHRTEPTQFRVPFAEKIASKFAGVPFSLERGSPRTEATLAFALLLVIFLVTIRDPRNPSLYAAISYRTHPTLINYLLGGPTTYPCPPERTGCSAKPVEFKDVALIQELTQPSDRVALLSLQDWTNLIEAKRASKFHFLPSAVMFTERQMTESLRDLNLIFLPREPADKLGIDNPTMASALLPMLRQHFEIVAEGATLLAWRRMTSASGALHK